MTILLQLKDAVKQAGDKLLLDGADLTITEGQRIGLVGRNGCGKSTLCRVLIADEELDAGQLMRHPELRVGYLRQHDPFEPGETVLGFLMRDSGCEDWRCGKVAGQFELKGPRLEGPVHDLSGGWQTRVKLAALLLHDPNLLVLDEPTNFLDLRTQLLLERFLDEYKGTTLVVSHDRSFLERCCDQTLELSRGLLTHYPGTIQKFLEFKEERKEHIQRSNAAIQAKRKQLTRFIEKNRAGANTASQARSKAKQLERLELEEIETSEIRAAIRVPAVEARKGAALRVEELAIGYPDHEVARKITLEVEYGRRAAIVGDNGQGKTTFLRSVTGSLEPKAGEVKWGYGCDIGVYAQHVYTSLPPTLTVLEYLELQAEAGLSRQVVLDTAGSFLFRGDDVQKRVEVLSGGERARLCLAGLLLGRHTVLALDEPGNHLDVETVEALCAALRRYQGTIVFTSHDRHFMGLVATDVIEVRDGGVVAYPGTYEQYVWRVEKEVEEGLRAEGGPAKRKESAEDKEKRKAEARRQHALRKEMKRAEQRLDKLEAEKRELEAEMMSVSDAHAARALHERMAKVAEKLEAAEMAWLELQEATGEL